MRFMMLLKADKRTEAGELPSRQDLEMMFETSDFPDVPADVVEMEKSFSAARSSKR